MPLSHIKITIYGLLSIVLINMLSACSDIPKRWDPQGYTVKKGDSLWAVSRKTGVAMNTIIRSNHGLLKRRMIRSGDKLVIR